MYKVKVVSSFSAAHFLREYKGKCEALHGHNWKVEAHVASEKLDALGMVMDFTELRGILDRTISEFDHTLINDIDFFKEHNPTSEYIASYLFAKIKAELPSPLILEEVRVWEKDTSCATYQE